MTKDTNDFRALHVGDLHFWRVPFNPMSYMNKRFLGIGNLLIGGRARKFRQGTAHILVDELKNRQTDTIFFSGDFTTTSLPSEFEAAANALKPAVKSLKTNAYAVPGNHDCYTIKDLNARWFEEKLGERYTPAKEALFSEFAPGYFLFQLNATTRNSLDSFGKIEPAHLEFIKARLNEISGTMKMLVFLCHFPAEEPPGVLTRDRGDQLRDSKLLLKTFQQLDCHVLWLHGHHHYRWAYGSPSTENLVYLNAGAPLLRRGAPEPDYGFHELIFGRSNVAIKSHRRDWKSRKWEIRDVPVPEPGEYINLQNWQ